MVGSELALPNHSLQPPKGAPTIKISEKDRLDLRQELERVFSNKRFAEIAMEAMPPIDYDQLATKTDLNALSLKLDGTTAELRGAMAELRGELKSDLANTTRLLFASQLATMVMIGGWVAAVT